MGNTRKGKGVPVKDRYGKRRGQEGVLGGE